MAWVTPVTNRTAIVRGKLDKIMLNRIEGNCEYLSSQLNLYGYSVSVLVKTDWDDDDFPYQSEMDRIKANVTSILAAYHTMNGSPIIDYANSIDWQNANSLEQNIKNIDTLLINMIADFKFSGEICSGEDDYS